VIGCAKGPASRVPVKRQGRRHSDVAGRGCFGNVQGESPIRRASLWRWREICEGNKRHFSGTSRGLDPGISIIQAARVVCRHGVSHAFSAKDGGIDTRVIHLPLTRLFASANHVAVPGLGSFRPEV
jgi:hypothetical protein